MPAWASYNLLFRLPCRLFRTITAAHGWARPSRADDPQLPLIEPTPSFCCHEYHLSFRLVGSDRRDDEGADRALTGDGLNLVRRVQRPRYSGAAAIRRAHVRPQRPQFIHSEVERKFTNLGPVTFRTFAIFDFITYPPPPSPGACAFLVIVPFGCRGRRQHGRCRSQQVRSAAPRAICGRPAEHDPLLLGPVLTSLTRRRRCKSRKIPLASASAFAIGSSLPRAALFWLIFIT